MLMAAFASGCGDDVTSVPAGCPDGAVPGAVLECRCSSGTRGVQRCGEDGNLERCECASDTSGTAAPATSGGTAPAGGAGGRERDAGGRATDGGVRKRDAGASAMDAATADSGAGTEPAPDAGADTGSTPIDSGTNMKPEVMPPPMTGDQLSICDEPSDCNPDLGCYTAGPGRGFCTRTCQDHVDCTDLGGANYTCSDDGLCEIDCSGGPPGVEKCPEGLICVQISGPGTGGVRNRCKYPASAGTSGDPFSACSVSAECDDGLECVGAFLTIAGYCTHACTESNECTERASSGTIEPACQTNVCALDCSADPEGCPDGMTCVETPLFSQCTYE